MRPRVLPRRLNYGNPVNWDAPLNRGLLLWYMVTPQRSGSSKLFDLASSYHGTLTSGPKWSGRTRPGGFGSIDYDGTDDKVDLGAMTVLNGITSFTFSAWINPTSLPFDAYRGVFSRGSSVHTPWIFGLSGTSVVRIEFATTTGPADDGLVSSAALTAGVWQQLVYTWNGATVTAYLNAVAGTSDATTGSILSNGNSNAVIGLISGFGYWLGQIDDVRFFTRCLSSGEVFDLYTASRTGYTKELNWLPDVVLGQAAAAGRPPSIFSSPIFNSPVIQGAT